MHLFPPAASTSRRPRLVRAPSPLCLLLAVACSSAAPRQRPAAAPATPREPATMHVLGRHLYTAAGERVVLRGVNEMFAFSRDRRGEWVMAEIARTGANAVRIVTTSTFPAADLDAVIASAVSHGMIPIPECHSATGRWERLQECVDYWVRPDVAEVVRRHQRWVLLNVANEAGAADVTAEEFLRGYGTAISRIRAAGIRVPLVIDGVDWGKEYRMLLDSWEELSRLDPERSVVVSAHSYWVGTEEERKAHYRYIIDSVTRREIPFILGEGPTPSGWDCTESPYQWAMDELERHQIGWLAWSWGLVRNGDCRDPGRYDLTDDGRFGAWRTEAGRLIAVDHPASIRNTSRRPCSIPNAGEGCVRATR